MHSQLARLRRVLPLELADQFLNAGVDVGTIETRDAGVDEACHVALGRRAIDRAVTAGEVPATLYDARHREPLAD